MAGEKKVFARLSFDSGEMFDACLTRSVDGGRLQNPASNGELRARAWREHFKKAIG